MKGERRMIYKKIRFKADPFSYNLEFDDRITLVGGDSGTGKTVLYEMLEDIRLTDEYKAIKLFNYKSDRFLESIKQCRNCFVVIDNADILINDDIRRYITFCLKIWKEVKQMMRTYLVTGGAGFIGSNYIHYMFEKYDNEIFIVNVDKLTYAGNLENLRDVEKRENYRFIKADICDAESIKQIFEEYDIDRVVHFAAESHVDRSIKDPEAFVKRMCWEHWLC